MATIHLPKNSAALMALAGKIIDKFEREDGHLEVSQSDIDFLKRSLAETEPAYKEVQRLRKKADEMNRALQAVLGTPNRNRKITPGTVRYVVAQVRDTLKMAHRFDLLRLKEWGFEVDEKSGG